MKINTQYSMSLDNNCFSEFNNWLRDIEVKGINNIMLFLTWPGKELQNSQQDLFSAMSEFIIYNNFWLSPIVSTFRYIILNKVNSLCLCEKSVDLFPDVSQLSYKEAFTFFKLLDVEEIRKILNVYCNSSFMFNTILDAIEKNDYNLFLEALANANHKQLMQYLSLLKMVSFEINNKGYIDNWGTVNDFQVFFWDTNFDCKERLIDIFSHPKELFLFPELYLSPTRYSSIKSFINPLDIIEAFNKSNKPEYLSQYCLYKDFINNISKELSNKEKCKKSIELLDEKLLSKQCRKWCYIIIRESIFTRLDELGFVPSKNKVYNDDDNNRETPNYVKRISDLEEKKNVISLTELREKLLRNNPDLSKITIPSDNNNEEDPKILYELRQALEKISKFTLESLDKIKEVFDEIGTILHPEKITNTFKMYILFYTSKVYHIYCSIKPLLTEQDSSVLEWYLNSSEYYRWYNSIISSTQTVLINNYNNNPDSLGNSEIDKHVPGFPRGEDKQPIYNFVLKEPLSKSELEKLYNCLVDEEFIDKYTPIQNLIHVLGGTRPKDYKPVHWIKKAKNNKICKKSVLNLMVYLGGNWDDISSSTKKDLLDRLNYCFVAGDTPFSYKNLKDSKSYNKKYYNAHSEARQQLLEIMGKVFGKDKKRYSDIQKLFDKSGLSVPS